MTKLSLLIDGPNFINSLIRFGIKHDLIAKQFSLERIEQIFKFDKFFRENQFSIDRIEFFCSDKQFGPQKDKFTRNEQQSMLQNLSREKGVHVNTVSIPGSSEKGVDSSIILRMDEILENSDHLILISSDRDFIPALQKFRKKNKVILTTSLTEDFPIELNNEAYYHITIFDYYSYLFKYKYPYYDMENFSIDECRDLISNADDSFANQLQVSKYGRIHVQKREYVDSDFPHDLKFHFETAVRYNGYFGSKAASDDDYVKEFLRDVSKCWEEGRDGFVDYV
jgi:uncharacterized LabA/DUF88 family protein